MTKSSQDEDHEGLKDGARSDRLHQTLSNLATSSRVGREISLLSGLWLQRKLWRVIFLLAFDVTITLFLMVGTSAAIRFLFGGDFTCAQSCYWGVLGVECCMFSATFILLSAGNATAVFVGNFSATYLSTTQRLQRSSLLLAALLVILMVNLLSSGSPWLLYFLAIPATFLSSFAGYRAAFAVQEWLK